MLLTFLSAGKGRRRNHQEVKRTLSTPDLHLFGRGKEEKLIYLFSQLAQRKGKGS